MHDDGVGEQRPGVGGTVGQFEHRAAGKYLAGVVAERIDGTEIRQEVRPDRGAVQRGEVVGLEECLDDELPVEVELEPFGTPPRERVQ